MNEKSEKTQYSHPAKTLLRTVPLVFYTAYLGACSTASIQQHKPSNMVLTADLVCPAPQRYANQKVADGHCVSLIKKCTGAPDTDAWRPGQYVLGNTVPAGAIIATFKNNRYPNKHGHHAAIYIRQDKNGIWVWDQWLGKPVHQRLIKIRYDGADPGNTAQQYRLVRIPSTR